MTLLSLYGPTNINHWNGITRSKALSLEAPRLTQAFTKYPTRILLEDGKGKDIMQTFFALLTFVEAEVKGSCV